jgi:hypothetical protein
MKSLTSVLPELRKYRVSLILANHYLDQLDPEIRYALLGASTHSSPSGWGRPMPGSWLGNSIRSLRLQTRQTSRTTRSTCGLWSRGP